jgi:hypothetical protein
MTAGILTDIVVWTGAVPTPLPSVVTVSFLSAPAKSYMFTGSPLHFGATNALLCLLVPWSCRNIHVSSSAMVLWRKFGSACVQYKTSMQTLSRFSRWPSMKYFGTRAHTLFEVGWWGLMSTPYPTPFLLLHMLITIIALFRTARTSSPHFPNIFISFCCCWWAYSRVVLHIFRRLCYLSLRQYRFPVNFV